jgi:hypothetical protein
LPVLAYVVGPCREVCHRIEAGRPTETPESGTNRIVCKKIADHSARMGAEVLLRDESDGLVAVAAPRRGGRRRAQQHQYEGPHACLPSAWYNDGATAVHEWLKMHGRLPLRKPSVVLRSWGRQGAPSA